ncbi:hypothetical protein LTR99_006006 [Exophiala xenobiotica]|uniref:Uncharacterized protein n=1 Tax=Vermiconidia calcicola TaxID=1690605 RepID=A0AAV9QDX1_9PEZI|nr:hypothetical protein LTR99_006006 [Exophiala xenobiotica]KAK5340745.1 hypothetical protein LTR98_003867 [Exophiala xenobiotica]KAK5431242.1 hypothetical protein LTR34_005801 [Exophiala xenobiotica]KAK5540922.1 hypothetical protein LTR25_002699 [Vermiconidia calcicola]KAK5554882.1 hypothetical protein LTR46_007086 [Exophiala xenobiotica]
MDSMRSLNTSLPSTRPAPPEQLLQAFRNAALSVTNLYKSAVTDQNSARQTGYQEALEDLLSFLDRENLGLQDGEGWRQPSEDDEDRSEAGPRPRSVSPVKEDAPASSNTTSTEPPKAESSGQTEEPDTTTHRDHTPTPMFHFTANTALSSSEDMQTDDNNHPSDGADANSSSSIRLEVLNNRGSRTPHRHGNQRIGNRSLNRDFTFTSGSKRKLQFPDFFDISNIGPRDGVGGSKRGRLS